MPRVAFRPRDFVRVSGPDAEDFLDRMLSNDVAALAPGAACEALLLTPKARVIAPLVAWRRTADDFLLLTEEGLGEAVRAALARARFAAKAEIEPEPHESWLVLGEAEGGIPNAEYGVPAVEVLDERPEGEQIGPEELERLRIEARTPAWGKEIDDRVLPAEAGLVERAVNLTKGCFPGQEPIARLHYRGHANRGLRLLEVDGSPAPETEVLLGEKAVGRITSVADGLALAYVRAEVPEDAELAVGDRTARQLHEIARAPVAQGIERSPAEAEARGSNPLGRISRTDFPRTHCCPGTPYSWPMTVCPSCGQENPAGFRLCGMCGSPLTVSPAAARQERKVLTVLFADLVGFTSRAEEMDPEDVRALLSPYWERLRSELERFGGTVEKFIGDAVVALFGAPTAHEDDPERAVRAALAIRDWVADESGLHVRVGVNTGEALVSLGARPAEGEGMASGDVVNTAARLQAAAPVNGVLVGEQTYRATERAIEYREHEPVQAKGKAKPVRTWEAVRARSRFGVDLARPSRAPLIGRDQELEVLLAALARAADDRTPQLVTLVGVPGIGKSRLLAELFGVIDRGERPVMWRQGRSLPYGEGVSYWALGEMIKAQAGVLETDDPDEATQKLRTAVEGVLPDAGESAWVESHLRPLVGLAADEVTGDRRGEAFAAWRRFFEGLAEQHPLVLVFEDLHWADEGLLDFVDELVDWLTDVPLLAVASSRPELLARRPAWGGGKANATTISLSPLSDEETARLVHALLAKSALPADVQSALLERAGGNPLYAEEFVHMVAERGSEEAELPGSVQGIIAARLDAVDVEDKELLQHAAVIGKVFWSGALAAIAERERFHVDERLHALERRELVRRERTSSVGGEREYAFRHVLVRDVAYGSIPRAARAERHRRAAEWIESLGRPEDNADLLAHHYLAALELARAAGVDAGLLASSAASALQRAGERAFGLNAFASAARFYGEALALGVAASERPLVLFKHGAALHLSADERRIEVLEAARDALLAGDDVETAAEACVLLAEAWWHRGQNDRAREQLERAQELVRGRPASRSVARVLVEASRYAMLSDAMDSAVRTGREALEMAEQLGLAELIPSALINIGVARVQAGDGSGMADLERAIEIGLATNNPDVARAYNNLAAVEDHAERVHELQLLGKGAADRLGNATVGRYIEGQLIITEYDLGRWDEFLHAADEFIASCEAGSPNYNEQYVHGKRARVLLARDDTEAADAAAARALELAREAKDPQSLQPGLAVRLHVDLALGRLGDAERTARELLSLLGAGPTTFGALELALAAESLGLTEEVRRAISQHPNRPGIEASAAVLDGEFERGADIVRDHGWRPEEAELRLRAAGAYAAVGRRAEADEQLREALAFYRSVGATRYIREGQTLIAATA